jgi:hypothetical protein
MALRLYAASRASRGALARRLRGLVVQFGLSLLACVASRPSGCASYAIDARRLKTISEAGEIRLRAS